MEKTHICFMTFGNPATGAEGPELADANLSEDGKVKIGLARKMVANHFPEGFKMIFLPANFRPASETANIMNDHQSSDGGQIFELEELFISQDRGMLRERLREALNIHLRGGSSEINREWLDGLGEKAWKAIRSNIERMLPETALVVCSDLMIRLILIASGCPKEMALGMSLDHGEGCFVEIGREMSVRSIIPFHIGVVGTSKTGA